jgi:hypothetical protein
VPSSKEGPAGQASSPRDFLNAMFCIDNRGRALRGRRARQLDCDELERFDVEAVAHHPYRRGAFTPLLAKPRKGEISIANVDDLERIMTFAQRRRLLPRGIPIHYTEFGVSSRPPAARGKGVSLSKQAEWLNQADYLAYKQRAVRSTAQFQLEDDSNLKTLIFQTGIRRADSGADLGRAKPSYAAYRLPLYVVQQGSRLEVFGGVRPHDGAETVELQFRRGRRGSFSRVADIGTNSAGWFLRRIALRRGFYRIAWEDPDGDELVSRVAKIRKR